MRTIGTFLVGAVAVTGLIVVTACGKKDDAPQPVAPTAQAGYPPPGTPGYPPPGTPGYPPAPGPGGYPPPTATAPPPAPPAPTAPPAPPAGGTMSVPGPLAAPCNADGPSCGTHHCNTQYQKCAFPCVNAETDCISPNGCVLGLCVPKLPGT